MEISEKIKDSLQELINTGVGRAAAAFSEMLRQEIALKVPQLLILTLDQLRTYMATLPDRDYVNVIQEFRGGLQGKGVVSFPVHGGKTLINTLLEHPESQQDSVEFDLSEREVIAEIGNLLINAVGSTISNMANTEISLSLPEVQFSAEMLAVDQESEKNIYCVGQGFFVIQGINVEGTILFIYAYDNIEGLMNQIEPSDNRTSIQALLVDDSLLIRQTLKRFFRALPYLKITLMEASNGKDGLTLFEQSPPDLLIMDLLMPGMGGEEVLAKLRHIPHHCFITILSSNFQKPVRERIFSLGAHQFIEKPITAEKLDLILKNYTEHKAGKQT